MAWGNGSLARGGEKCGGEVVESSRVGRCYNLSASSRGKTRPVGKAVVVKQELREMRLSWFGLIYLRGVRH
jgi:hypothetical protein